MIKKGYSFLLPLGLLVINLALKLFFIDVMPLGHDEPHTIHFASLDAAQKIFFEATKTQNPPLFELILHYWMQLFGKTLFSCRFLPVIFNSLAVIPIYGIGKELSGKNVGLLAALIFTFSTLHIHHSHNIRVYALYTLLSSLSMYAYIKTWNRPKSKKYWTVLTLANAINLYVHFFTAFVIFVQGSSVLFFGSLRRKLLRNYLLSSLGTLLLFSPYIPYMVQAFLENSSGSGGIGTPGVKALAGMTFKFLNNPFSALIFLLVLSVGLAKFFLSSSKKFREHFRLDDPLGILIIWSLGLYLILFLISQKTPVFIGRYLLFVSLGFYLLLALLIVRLFYERWMRWTASGVLVVVMMITCKPNHDFYSSRGDDRTLIEHLLDPPSSSDQTLREGMKESKYNKMYFSDFRKTPIKKRTRASIDFLYKPLCKKLNKSASSRVLLTHGPFTKIVSQPIPAHWDRRSLAFPVETRESIPDHAGRDGVRDLRGSAGRGISRIDRRI